MDWKTPIINALSLVIFLMPSYLVQGQPGLCPCNFHFHKEDPADPACYGTVPLIAGIKDIELDDTVIHRTKNISFSWAIARSCLHVDAFIYVWNNDMSEDEKKNHIKKIGEVQGDKISVFFTQSSGDITSEDKDPEESQSCGFVEKGAASLKIEDCDIIAASNTHVVTALCKASPVEDVKSEEAVKQCICPCAFFPDHQYNCFRETEICIPVNSSDNMIEACSTVGNAPSIPARVMDVKDASPHWPEDALFFVGKLPENEKETGNLQCGFTDSITKKVIHKKCTELLNENADKEKFFFYVICNTYELNKSIQQECGNDNDMLFLDEPDCGAMGIFEGIVKLILIMAIVLMIVEKVINDQI